MFIRTESFKDFIRFYPVVSTIIGIQTIIWLSFIFFPPGDNLLFQWGVGINFVVANGEYWRLITPIFLHDPSSVMHLLFNSFSLVLFGPPLEQMLGKVRFIMVYLLTGIIGNLFTYFMDPYAMTLHVGASGAIYGLFGIYVYMNFFKKHLIDRSSAQIVTIILIIGFVMTFLRPGINIFAHLFGFIGGLAIGPIFFRNVKPFSPWRNQRRVNNGNIIFDPNRWSKKRLPIKRYAKPLLWGAFILLVILGLLGRFL